MLPVYLLALRAVSLVPLPIGALLHVTSLISAIHVAVFAGVHVVTFVGRPGLSSPISGAGTSGDARGFHTVRSVSVNIIPGSTSLSRPIT